MAKTSSEAAMRLVQQHPKAELEEIKQHLQNTKTQLETRQRELKAQPTAKRPRLGRAADTAIAAPAPALAPAAADVPPAMAELPTQAKPGSYLKDILQSKINNKILSIVASADNIAATSTIPPLNTFADRVRSNHLLQSAPTENEVNITGILTQPAGPTERAGQQTRGWSI